VTTGVYGIVRNPIYSAFLFIFSGVLLLFRNWFLLILPFVFWALLTLLMKFTEEIWLKDKFGKEYTAYCKKVNRVIPWFRR
ncbi:MAG: isoprenylcysteine carboxylmethyltransferase family protein, partial [Treponemataceae bacterium]